ncbi:hypothetical protein RLOC_00011109 [Lonchura striata]|uniref:Uncharacterized protein n=1 Tax=Lonchura striata TaxID=40157 RepID=A0A218VEK6_9PASE|nr:hypothetical protein RLOC_00011109 [Lonchura striata domestica]
MWLSYCNCRGMRGKESWDISIPLIFSYMLFLTTCLKLHQLLSVYCFFLMQTSVCRILC